jgi:hypothetical protein
MFLLGPLLMLVEMWIGLAVIVSFFSGDLRDVCLLDVVCGLGVVSVCCGFCVSGGELRFSPQRRVSLCEEFVLWISFSSPELAGFPPGR